MRAWTLGVSVVFHFCLICGVIVAPLLATDDLPTPPRAAPEYVLVTARLPDPPVARTQLSARTSSSPVPVQPRDGIVEEPAVEPSPRADAIDTSFGAPTASGGTGLVPGAIVAGDPLPPPPEPPKPVAPIPVGGVIRPPTRVVYVAPKYPPLAQQSRVHGMVILEAIVATDGGVQDVSVLKSEHALLTPAAVDAVRQWRFTPTLLNGQPVPVLLTVTVSFTLP